MLRVVLCHNRFARGHSNQSTFQAPQAPVLATIIVASACLSQRSSLGKHAHGKQDLHLCPYNVTCSPALVYFLLKAPSNGRGLNFLACVYTANTNSELQLTTYL